MMEMSTWLIWFVAGLGLGIAEMVVPGFIIIFFGIGCMGAALVAAFLPDAYTIQVAAFIAVSVGSLVGLRKIAIKMLRGRSQAPAGVGESSIEPGTRITVENAIPPGGKGRVRYRGTMWDARSAEGVAAGAEAEITGVDDMNRSCLLLRPVSSGTGSD